MQGGVNVEKGWCIGRERWCTGNTTLYNNAMSMQEMDVLSQPPTATVHFPHKAGQTGRRILVGYVNKLLKLVGFDAIFGKR